MGEQKHLLLCSEGKLAGWMWLGWEAQRERGKAKGRSGRSNTQRIKLPKGRGKDLCCLPEPEDSWVVLYLHVRIITHLRK